MFCFHFLLDLRCAAIDEQLDACNELESSDTRKSAAGAISRGLPIRPIGIMET